MSIWRNCWTAVIFKSIVPPHATCELKRMCFPNDIQCLLLSCWFLGHYWNSFSVASWLIHHQQFRGTEDAKCWKWSMWACCTLRFVRILSAWLPHIQSKKKRFLHIERTQQAGSSLVLLYSALAGYKDQELDYRDSLKERSACDRLSKSGKE